MTQLDPDRHCGTIGRGEREAQAGLFESRVLPGRRRSPAKEPAVELASAERPFGGLDARRWTQMIPCRISCADAEQQSYDRSANRAPADREDRRSSESQHGRRDNSRQSRLVHDGRGPLHRQLLQHGGHCGVGAACGKQRAQNGQRHAPPRQSRFQQLAPAMHAVFQCAGVNLQVLGGLLLRSTFEQANNDRRAQGVGEPRNFFIEDSAHFAPGDLVGGDSFAGGRFAGEWGVFHEAADLLFSLTGAASARFSRQAHGDRLQPAGHGIAVSDRLRIAHEFQETSLEHVFCVLNVSRDTAADAENIGAVPLHEQ